MILDQDALGAGLMKGNLEPWFRFEVGPDNLFETRPLQVTDHSEAKVTIECEDSVVKLDLETGAAQRQTPDGAHWIYYGGMGRSQRRLGWMPFPDRRARAWRWTKPLGNAVGSLAHLTSH